MVDIVFSVAAKVSEYLVVPVVRQLGYLFNYRTNIEDLSQEVEKLRDARDRHQHSVNEAIGNGHKIEDYVCKWLTRADGFIQDACKFLEDEKEAQKSCFNGLCPNLKSRHQLSREARKKAGVSVQILENGQFEKVSYRTPLQGIRTAPSEALESRMLTLNEVMEALRDANINRIGLWGMGGVGKSTLVKHLAEQANQEKLFDKVVKVSVLQTPDLERIQRELADGLGMKFEEESEQGRAARLLQRMEAEKTILIILDDLWAELELEKVGIPSPDDHKGCKLVLTSRNKQVLSNEMSTQKDFRVRHLQEDETWILFKNTAGDSIENPELQPIAVDVAKECAGLPLAIVTVAKALENKNVSIWKDALQQLKSQTSTNITGIETKVYSSLKLSYEHLEGDEVKSLCLLCGLFSSYIHIRDLLKYGVGLRLFQGTNTLEEAKNRIDTLVDNLKSSNFLLEIGHNAVVRMHDLVRSTARKITSEQRHVFTHQKTTVRVEEWSRIDELQVTWVKLHDCDIHELPEGLRNSTVDSSKAVRFEQFFHDKSNSVRCHIKLVPIRGFVCQVAAKRHVFENLVRYRILVGDVWSWEEIFEANSTLKLNKFDTSLHLVDGISKLLKRTEDLHLRELCGGTNVLSKLNREGFLKLKHLNVESSPEIQYIVNSMDLTPSHGAFPVMETLSLNQLINLQEVCVANFQHGRKEIKEDAVNVPLFPELRYLTLEDLPKLSNFCFEENPVLPKPASTIAGPSTPPLNQPLEHVFDLEELNVDDGHVGLPKLRHICNCGSSRNHFPSSMASAPVGNIIFPKLFHIFLQFLPNLTSFVSPGYHSLQRLHRADLDTPFPVLFYERSLQFLRAVDCSSLEAVFDVEGTNVNVNVDRSSLGNTFVFPKVTTLFLSHLHQLRSFYPEAHTSQWPLLERLMVYDCHKLNVFAFETPTFQQRHGEGNLDMPLFLLPHVAFPNLEELALGQNRDTEIWPEQFPVDSFPRLRFLAKSLVKLKTLKIGGSDMMEEVVANEGREATDEITLPNLTSFSSSGYIFSFPSLEQMLVKECPKMKMFSPSLVTTPRLERIKVGDDEWPW
ncbi:putative disease resistance protein [Vitis vinifera]|uniref:Putative disease resistance protein n=1 Tax=Vitis vinifera TaxID=29760 RepID=A0A438GEQ4_VITVI|nr:putative disease resistance protein [Vitis vinifera]